MQVRAFLEAIDRAERAEMAARLTLLWVAQHGSAKDVEHVLKELDR
ncbi:hypothetical protein [Sulfurivermis fontis]|nr:hypothetical protein [Sulfurivermis fontis]